MVEYKMLHCGHGMVYLILSQGKSARALEVSVLHWCRVACPRCLSTLIARTQRFVPGGDALRSFQGFVRSANGDLNLYRRMLEKVVQKVESKPICFYFC